MLKMLQNWVALAVTVVGLVVLAYAGVKKEREQERYRSAGLLQKSYTEAAEKPSFVVGLMVCLLSGALSPMLNFSISFGKPIQALTMNTTIHGHPVKHLDANSPWGPNPVWSIGVASGFVVNLLYTVYKLIQNGTGRDFFADGNTMAPLGYNSHDVRPWYYAAPGGLGNWIWTFIMGLLWFAGNILYGVGATQMGDLGTAVGWPVFMISSECATSHRWRCWRCHCLMSLMRCWWMSSIPSTMSHCCTRSAWIRHLQEPILWSYTTTDYLSTSDHHHLTNYSLVVPILA